MEFLQYEVAAVVVAAVVVVILVADPALRVEGETRIL